MLRLLILAILLCSTAPTWAATYYVATTGSDSSATPTNQNTPYRSIQKCVTVVVAGDTCEVADGTYTDVDGAAPAQTAGLVAFVRPTYTNGTAGAPITVKATNYLGATITVPSDFSGTNAGFYIQRNYYIIQGFNIQGGASTGASASHHGIVLDTGSDGTIVRRNHIHDIARTLCTNSGSGNTGVYHNGGTGNVVEYNWIHAIGRLRNGESGCVTTKWQHDHGMYLHGGTNLTIRRNVIYDANRGFAIQFFGSTMTNTVIANNTIGGHATENTATAFCGASSSGLPCPRGQVVFGSTITTAALSNNIFYDPGDGPFRGASPSCTAITYDYNLTDNTTRPTMWNTGDTGKPLCALDGGHNLTSTSPGFVSAGTNDYTIATGSATIGAGTAVTGLLSNGTIDIGAFETFTCNASATVNGNLLDTSCAMNLNTPVLPATGITGMTALVAAVPRTTTTSAKLSDSVVRTTFQGGACAGGETWTNTYVPGNLTDSALIGGSLNQKAFAYTALAVTNGCGSSSGPTFTPVASTSFTGALENPLSEGGVWTNGGGQYKRESNTAVPLGFGADAWTLYSGLSFNNDQYSRADITTVGTGGGGRGQGLTVRASTSVHAGYVFHIDHAASNNAELACFTSGTYHNLDNWTQAFTDGDQFTLAVAGSTLYVYDKTLALVRTKVDATCTSLVSGLPGLSYSSASTSTSADNWSAGTFSTASAPPPVVGTLEQKTHWFTTAQSPELGLDVVGAANTSVRRGTAFALNIQTDCTVSACDSIGEVIYYRRNTGAYVPLTDTLGGDQIAFFGSTSDPSYLSGALPTCLSGALTPVTGATQFTSAAIPVFTLAQNRCIRHRWQIRFGPTAVLNDTYEFLAYVQTGAVLAGGSTPAGGAKITVTPASTIAAPASLHVSGANSNTLIDLIWAPVTDVSLSGYNIYACVVTPCTLAIGTRIGQNTPATSTATHSSITTFRTAASVSGTYYFVVTAFDSGGQESVVSNEVAVVRTGFTAPAVRVP